MKEDKLRKAFRFSSYPTHKIALKLLYSGADYAGLAFQPDVPTVEGTLFSALAHCRLIDPSNGPEGCAWERCGRTDRGVSSAGQVVSLRVRAAQQPQPDLRYVSLLNRVLPPSIRVYAWSPVSSSFSARFSCLKRHYKYFFSPHGLDIAAMRNAAKRLEGEHDFRNLCKLDPSKQLSNYTRRILRADISPVSFPLFPNHPTQDLMYVFDLEGTAFLYNQVRHIMAVLFLVGARLEHPSVVTALLNADPHRPEQPFEHGEPQPELVTCKPEYVMADPLPLLLWDCVYDENDVTWRTDDGLVVAGGAGGDANVPPTPGNSVGPESEPAILHLGQPTLFPSAVLPALSPTPARGDTRLHDELRARYTRSLISTTIDAHFLRVIDAFQAAPSPPAVPPSVAASTPAATSSPSPSPSPSSSSRPHSLPLASSTPELSSSSPSSSSSSSSSNIVITQLVSPTPLPATITTTTTPLSIPLGAGTTQTLSKAAYKPLLQRKRLQHVDVANARWKAAADERKRRVQAKAGSELDSEGPGEEAGAEDGKRRVQGKPGSDLDLPLESEGPEEEAGAERVRRKEEADAE